VLISTTNVTLEDGVTPANLAGLAFDDGAICGRRKVLMIN
jgi:hypothetical protein